MTTEHGKTLLMQARQSIVNQFGKTDPVEVNAPWLMELGATFVTLTQQGRLRGCIGSLQAHRALLEDVRQNAVAAAFRDPRFEPLIAEELGVTQVEVSLLSPHEPMIFSSEEEVLKQLRPGIDGVVFSVVTIAAHFYRKFGSNCRNRNNSWRISNAKPDCPSAFGRMKSNLRATR